MYDTFLARFEFFRKFLKILLDIAEKQEKLEQESWNALEEHLQLKKQVEELQRIVLDIQSAPTETKDTARNFTTATDILDRHYKMITDDRK